jgi:hypothetical protein
VCLLSVSHALHLAAAARWQRDAIDAIRAAHISQAEQERHLFYVHSSSTPQPAAIANRDHRGVAIPAEEWRATVRLRLLQHEHTQERVGDAVRARPVCPLCGANTGFRGLHEATHGCSASSSLTRNHNAAQKAIMAGLTAGLGAAVTVSPEPVLGSLHDIGGMKPDAQADSRADILVRSNSDHGKFVIVDLIIACPVGNNRRAASIEGGVAAAAAEKRKGQHYAKVLNQPGVVVPWAIEPGGLHGKLGIKALTAMVKLAKNEVDGVEPLPVRGMTSHRCVSIFYDVLQRVNCALWRGIGRDILRQREALRHSARHDFLLLRRENNQYIIRPGQAQRSKAEVAALRLGNAAQMGVAG